MSQVFVMDVLERPDEGPEGYWCDFPTVPREGELIMNTEGTAHRVERVIWKVYDALTGNVGFRPTIMVCQIEEYQTPDEIRTAERQRVIQAAGALYDEWECSKVAGDFVEDLLKKLETP